MSLKPADFRSLTLLDYPGLTAATVFTSGCNFRCPFCHNSSLVLGSGLADKSAAGDDVGERFFALLKKRRGLLDGVCVTGGEPLLHGELPEFLEKIKALGYKIKLDTNGSFPERLTDIIRAGLCDYVAMDIKTSFSRYGLLNGIRNYDAAPVKRSAEILMSGSLPFEFRTTVVEELHREEDFYEIARDLEGNENYFLQGFVDSGDILSSGLSACSHEKMNVYLNILKAGIPNAMLRGV